MSSFHGTAQYRGGHLDQAAVMVIIRMVLVTPLCVTAGQI